MPRVLVEHGFATRSVQLLIARIPHDFQGMPRVPMLGGARWKVCVELYMVVRKVIVAYLSSAPLLFENNYSISCTALEFASSVLWGGGRDHQRPNARPRT